MVAELAAAQHLKAGVVERHDVKGRGACRLCLEWVTAAGG